MVFDSKRILDYYLTERETQNEENAKKIFVLKVDSNSRDADVFTFYSEQAVDIVALLREYSPKTESPKANDAEITQEETLKLALENIRNNLLASNLLHLPGPETTGISQPKSKGKGFLRKMSSMSLDSLQNSLENLNEEKNMYMYTLSDWEYSQTLLTTSITALPDKESEKWAVNTYFQISEFSKSRNSKSTDNLPAMHKPSYVTTLQQIIAKCIESTALRNEVYAQLVKQTTNHPNPNSSSAHEYWRFLRVLAGVAAPTDLYLSYLRVHLQMYLNMNPSITMSGYNHERPRPTKDESKYASSCLEALKMTSNSTPRKFPPSSEEIFCNSSFKPLVIRVYLMDGQFRVMQITSTTTIDEVLGQLLDKVGLKDSFGFSIYETFQGIERSIPKTEKFSDILYKWEKFAKTNNMHDIVGFLLKKRLFLPSETQTPIEESLILSQIMEDVRNDFFPLDHQDSLKLCALYTQSSYKDTSISYEEILPQVLPPRSICASMAKDVELTHIEYKLMSSADANKEILKLFKEWRLFGAMIYEVWQSQADTYPNNCWLVVHYSGVYILHRYSKREILNMYSQHPKRHK
ncbi:cytochrome c oxidase subunit 1 [Nowakowskiella sp. JEL0407]|nr:cytochrome c oxidase subunit 1 [Nowakowskiella sp. JEL0407]